MELHIIENSHQDILLNELDPQVKIKVDERINTSLMLTYSGVEIEGSIHLEMREGSQLKLLLKNESKSLKLKIESTLLKDSDLHFAYCDLDEGIVDVTGNFQLLEEGAHADIRSACIVSQHQHFKVSCIHELPYTTGIMEHYAVVKEHGDYRMEACGKIIKGAHDAASHQTTRILTMSEQQTSEVVPLLLIDEFDVKASHATTLGQPDENQLYYLQTRGLTREQALGLLSIGYIMPIADIFDDKKRNDALKDEIEMKVGLHA